MWETKAARRAVVLKDALGVEGAGARRAVNVERHSDREIIWLKTKCTCTSRL